MAIHQFVVGGSVTGQGRNGDEINIWRGSTGIGEKDGVAASLKRDGRYGQVIRLRSATRREADGDWRSPIDAERGRTLGQIPIRVPDLQRVLTR